MNTTNKNTEKLSIELSDNFVCISNSSFEFLGSYSKSENGIYLLVWNDDNLSKEKENFFLLENNNIILKGKLQKPNDGKVANNGRLFLMIG